MFGNDRIYLLNPKDLNPSPPLLIEKRSIRSQAFKAAPDRNYLYNTILVLIQRGTAVVTRRLEATLPGEIQLGHRIVWRENPAVPAPAAEPSPCLWRKRTAVSSMRAWVCEPSHSSKCPARKLYDAA